MNYTKREEELRYWLKQHNYPATQLIPASSDASARRYFRIACEDKSFIAVDTPLPEAENRAFIELERALSAAGLTTPTVYHADSTMGFMLIEDLGLQTFADALGSTTEPNHLYQQAIKTVAHIQNNDSLHQLSESLPTYNAEMVIRELEIFTTWCLSNHLGITLDQQDKEHLRELHTLCSQTFSEQPQTFTHRDFHCRNLMVQSNDQLGLIDFQGAVRGPITYDWVSLLRDCYTDLAPEQLDANFHLLFTLVGEKHLNRHSKNTVRRWFDLTGMQRHLKAIGIFCRLKQQDKKSTYMQDVPRTFNYVISVAHHYPELIPLRRLIEKHQLAEKLC